MRGTSAVFVCLLSEALVPEALQRDQKHARGCNGAHIPGASDEGGVCGRDTTLTARKER